MDTWTSPDNKIKKVILKNGVFGNKPTECGQCTISIIDSNVNLSHVSNTRCIGDTDSEFTRLLDVALQMMNVKEVARVTFSTNNVIEFTLELCDYDSHGFIFDWSAEEKFEIASKYKARGNNFVKNNQMINASHQFSRGLKILLSIPYNVVEQPTHIDTVSVSDIKVLQSIFYSNLAFCYLKVKDFERVISLCEKVLTLDSNNIKSLYRMGSAYYELQCYNKAEATLVKALDIEPDNRAVLKMLKDCRDELNHENTTYTNIVKKMFQ